MGVDTFHRPIPIVCLLGCIMVAYLSISACLISVKFIYTMEFGGNGMLSLLMMHYMFFKTSVPPAHVSTEALAPVMRQDGTAHVSRATRAKLVKLVYQDNLPTHATKFCYPSENGGLIPQICYATKCLQHLQVQFKIINMKVRFLNSPVCVTPLPQT